MKYTRKHRSRMGSTRKHRAWGYHLIVNAANCNAEAIRSKQTITAFVKALVPAIGMKAYGPPKIARFGDGTLEGNTLIQLIETSNISAHFDEVLNDAYFDVFSCKSFDPKVALAVFHEFFQPTKVQTKFFPRQAPKH